MPEGNLTTCCCISEGQTPNAKMIHYWFASRVTTMNMIAGNFEVVNVASTPMISWQCLKASLDNERQIKQDFCPVSMCAKLSACLKAIPKNFWTTSTRQMFTSTSFLSDGQFSLDSTCLAPVKKRMRGRPKKKRNRRYDITKEGVPSP